MTAQPAPTDPPGTAPRRYGRHRWRRWWVRSLALAVIALAGLLALARLLFPLLAEHPEPIARWLSAVFAQPVAFERLDAHWDGSGPSFEVRGLTIGERSSALVIEHARLRLDPYAALRPGRRWVRELVVLGLELELVRAADRSWSWHGIELNRTASGGGLLGVVEVLSLGGSRLRVIDAASGTVLEAEVRGRLEQDREGLRAALVLSRPEAGSIELRLRRGSTPWFGSPGWQAYLMARQWQPALWLTATPADGAAPIAGRLSGQVWFEPARGFDWRARGWFEPEDVVLRAPVLSLERGVDVAPHLRLPAGRVDFDLNIGAEQSVLVLATEGDGRLEWRGNAAAWQLAAAELDLDLLGRLALCLAELPGAARSWLYHAQPRGRLRWASVTGSAARAPVFWLDLRELETRPLSGRWPGFEVARLELEGDDRGGRFLVAASALGVEPAGILRDRLSSPRASLAGGWSLGAERRLWLSELHWPSPTVSFSGSGALSAPPGGPLELELAMRVERVEVAALGAFWPLRVMPARTIEWLDRGLVAGYGENGRVLFRGRFDGHEWPADGRRGRLEAELSVRDAVLDYDRDWPRAEQLGGVLRFVDRGMTFEAFAGRVLDVDVARIDGRIADLKEPVLSLTMQSQSEAEALLRLLRQSPLRRQHGEILERSVSAGPATVHLALDLPFKKRLGAPRLLGTVDLAGVAYEQPDWNLYFSGLEGRVEFNEAGFTARDLHLIARARPARLSIDVGRYVEDSTLAVYAVLSGQFGARTLFGEHDALAGVLALASGQSDWRLDLRVPRDRGRPSLLRFESALRGIAIDLPEPWRKSAETARPFALAVELPLAPGAALRVDYGTDLSLRARVPEPGAPLRGVLALGRLSTWPEPPPQGLAIVGQLDTAPTAWTRFLPGGDAGGASPWSVSQVALDWRDGEGRPTRLVGRREGEEFQLTVDGPDLSGSLRHRPARAGTRAVLVGEFKRVVLPEWRDARPRAAPDPRRLPAIYLHVESLRFGAAELGELRLEAHPDERGLRIERFEARSPDLQIRADGAWTRIEQDDQSRFTIQFSAEDLGRMLRALGFSEMIAGGQTLARIEAAWNGAPTEFRMDRLGGSLAIEVGNGRILDVEPGAGRIFGLLSLRELPRRLALDFRDFFAQGLSFDRIVGRFELTEGNAWTQDLKISSPSADILVVGRTGLASRDYDQQVIVQPRMGNVLPLVGALAGGPAGAAVGFVAQGVLAPGIEGVNRIDYSIDGSWDQPRVERLQPARAPRADNRPRHSSNG